MSASGAEAQVRLLVDIQALLEDGRFVAICKHALLIGYLLGSKIAVNRLLRPYPDASPDQPMAAEPDPGSGPVA